MGTIREEIYIRELEFCEKNKDIEKRVVRESEVSFTNFLADQTVAKLNEFGKTVDDIESNEVYKMSSDLHKISQLYRMLQKEKTAGVRLYSYDTSDYTSFLQKYDLTVYYIRRLVLDLSAELVKEAEHELLKLRPSYQVIMTVADNDLKKDGDAVIEVMDKLYSKI